MFYVYIKVKVILQQEVAQGVPGWLRPRIFLTFGTIRVVGRQPYIPTAFTPGEIPGTHFQRLSRPQGTWFRRGEPRKESLATPGIDPVTFRLVAQCHNHCATPGPIYIYIYIYIHISIIYINIYMYVYIMDLEFSRAPTCPCLKPDSFSQSNPILFFNFILIASFHLCLGLPSGLSFMFPYQTPVCISLLPHTCPTCSPHPSPVF